MFIVDSQIHLWTGLGAPPHHRQIPYTIAEALRDMQDAGVARAVNCPAIWDPEANDYAVEAARQYPDRFATTGWFPLDTPQPPVFVERFLSRPGMLGLRFVLMQPQIVDALKKRRLDWVWRVANDLSRPVALILPKPLLPLVDDLATRFPQINFLIDHLNIGPHDTLPAATNHLDALCALAQRPNIGIKASASASMSNEAYPFRDVSPVLERVFQAFGPDRMFWGTDFTRMTISLRQCVEVFTQHLEWLQGEDLEKVMGLAVCKWLNWLTPET